MANGTVLRESGGRVRRVGGSAVVGLVAVPAGRAGQAVVVVHVALGAQHIRRMEAREGEARGGVVERGAGPIRGRVAPGTVLRESGGQMRRIGGCLVIGLVTVPAGAASKGVIVAHVALGALQAGVRASQREARGGVVERRTRPVEGRGSVAPGAVLRESGGQVRRAEGAFIVGLVAVPAGRAGQAVVVADVARGALRGGVDTYQGEPGGRVIEGGAIPIGRGVASGAILREIGCFVRRGAGSVVVVLVAVPAGPAGQTVVVVHVALGALQAGVRAGQRESRGCMVEGRSGPVEGRGSVALGAVLREAGSQVRRTSGSVVVVLVAVPAGRAGQAVVVADVARGALLAGMEAHQCKPGGGVIERGATPIRRGVAAGAILREVGCFVRRGVGSVVVGLVTVPAGAAGQAVVVAHVAQGALHRQMKTGECEARGGVVERRTRPVEGRGSVAPGAVLREAGSQVRRAEGAIVVGLVAVPAGRAGQAVVVVHVARGALLARVETCQREAGCSPPDRSG